jgi:uncharacterized protein YbjT (DUF2867 family)
MLGTIVVAGATGTVGREVVRVLRARGHRVRALVRDMAKSRMLEADEVRVADALQAGSLVGAFDGASHAFSSVGASVSADPRAGRTSYLNIDVPAHKSLLSAARAAGVQRFVYVSAYGAPERRDVAYLRAHADVEDLLRASGMRYGIARPTGFFSAFAEYLDFAARGAVPEIGTGHARTNPIHPAELAELCADLVIGNQNETREVGGPEVLTRRGIVELAFKTLGRPVRVRRIPVGLARVASALARPLHPRLSELGQFLAAIAEMNVVAPAFGKRTLAEYFRERIRAHAVD